jgi:hypothetical protein
MRQHWQQILLQQCSNSEYLPDDSWHAVVCYQDTNSGNSSETFCIA